MLISLFSNNRFPLQLKFYMVVDDNMYNLHIFLLFEFFIHDLKYIFSLEAREHAIYPLGVLDMMSHENVGGLHMVIEYPLSELYVEVWYLFLFLL
jgi:hypothetical protein